MVIEFLKFKVDPNLRENYIQKDAEIWTAALAEYPGFLGKEVWINPDDPTEVIFLIRWTTLELLQAIPTSDAEKIEQRFAQAVGHTHELVQSGVYQVQELSQSA
ncbi:TIGR03792 family protein [Nostoc sp. TCL26-01]|uniref:TIGR03792 family protein n=1 Tax=Nostoc sp. TCL26-01 TaxID=2576904 RepID=UPI0015B8D2F6|nr:TIGR03792 family protein [Nostoc sp. TCL26-01]QLE55699.1 TIGR03792 family protein [Nostoc sp. TCL26-01]